MRSLIYSFALLSTAIMTLIVTPVQCYPENYLSPETGVVLTTQAKLWGEDKLDNLLSSGPISKGGFTFADIDQHQTFTVDFGRIREFDRVQIGSAGKGVERNVGNLRIEVSNKGPEGPYKKIVEKADLGYMQVLRTPLTKARWVRFDLGSGSKGVMVHSVRIYKGYKHPNLVEVTKILHQLIKPDVPGLEGFYKAADAGDWKKACKELRKYYSPNPEPDGPPNPKFDLSRAKAYAEGTLDFAGISRQEKVPIDWTYQANTDWYEHKNFLNRGSAIGVHIQAYYNTRDKKWAEQFKKFFYDWVDENPKPTVMSRADYPSWRTLDTACRAGWLYTQFSKVCVGKDIDDELWANFIYSTWEHADYLKNDNFSGGNWLATETSTVMNIALQFPEFKDQKTWLSYGKEGFETNVLRDVYPDGKETEDAPGYVCMAYAGMLGTMEALDKAGIAVNPEVKARMYRTQDFLMAVTQPDGNTPAIGDSGGGPPYALPHALQYYKRDDVKYVLTKGKEGTPPKAASVNFPQGGWSIMRSAYEESPYENARHLVFKSSSGSHGHIDVMNITAYAYGRELLIDPAIRSYEHADVLRYLQTSYHNTVCVDDKDRSRGGGTTDKWFSNAGLDYLLASQPAYKGLVHRRNVLFVKPDYWVVHDDIQGEGEHTYDQNWHFSEEAKPVEAADTKAVHTTFPSGGNLLMVPADTSSLESTITDFYIAKGPTNDGQGHVPSKGWRYRRKGASPQVFDLLLYPYNGSKCPDAKVNKPACEVNGTADVTALEVTAGDCKDYIIFSRSGQAKVTLKDSKLTVDGEVCILRLKGGKPVRLSGANLRSVSLGDKALFIREEAAADVDELLK